MVPTKFSVSIVLLLFLISFATSEYNLEDQNRLTQVDSIAHNYLKQEDYFWNNVLTNTPGQDDHVLQRIYTFHANELNLNFGKIESVQSVNEVLAELVISINHTQHQVSAILFEHKYGALKTFAEESVHQVTDKIRRLFEETDKRTFLDYLRANSDRCQKPFVAVNDENLYTDNVILDFYRTIAETLIKGYMTAQLFHMVLAQETTGGNQRRLATELRQEFTPKYRLYESRAKNIIKIPVQEIWNCDDYTTNDTYAEITNFLQGYIDNEVNLNAQGSCTGTCLDYELTENYGCKNGTYCRLNYLDYNKTRCNGSIRNCQFIESDMSLCPNEDDLMKSRRYNYVRYSSGLVLGKPQFCPDELKVKSWIRFLVSCSYCLCYCDYADYNSDRYFSLREAVSNINENKVVTGIRFVKRNRIIHLFISERILLPFGGIDNTTEREPNWKSDYNFFLEDYDVVHGRDYHNLTYESRAIDLDTIHIPPNQVVTGARLRVYNNRLRLEIRGTDFNYQGGDLSADPSHSRWYSGEEYKTKLPLENVDVSTRSPQQSIRYNTKNRYVEFVPTDIYKDIAQTTVPFIETLPVESKLPTPLSGAGIYYKSRPGYGGFIAISIIPYSVHVYRNESVYLGRRRPQY